MASAIVGNFFMVSTFDSDFGPRKVPASTFQNHESQLPHFYLDLLGFRQSDVFGSGGFFARYGTDHHALVIIDKQAADKMLADVAKATGVEQR